MVEYRSRKYHVDMLQAHGMVLYTSALSQSRDSVCISICRQSCHSTSGVHLGSLILCLFS